MLAPDRPPRISNREIAVRYYLNREPQVWLAMEANISQTRVHQIVEREKTRILQDLYKPARAFPFEGQAEYLHRCAGAIISILADT